MKKKCVQEEKLSLSSLDWPVEDPLARVTFLESAAEIRDDVHSVNTAHTHKVSTAARKAPPKDEIFENEIVVQYEGRGTQVAGTPGNAGETYLLRMCGSQQQVVVRSPLEQELSRHMLLPEVKDTSKFVLCPMPGLLVSLSK